MPTPDPDAPDGSKSSASRTVREVSVTELRRSARAVIDRVSRGEIAIVSRHGRPAAILLPVDDPASLMPPTVSEADMSELAHAF